MKVNDLNGEALALDAACRARGVTPIPPKRPGLPVDSWRAIALATLGRIPPDHAVGRGELLQAAGEISGTLHEVVDLDDSNRKHRKFYGSPEACWGTFKSIRGQVRKICNNPDADKGQLVQVISPLSGAILRLEHGDGTPFP